MSFIDIHCHPALKTWIFPKQHVYNSAHPINLRFSERIFMNLPNMKAGQLNAAVSVYYLPEANIETDLLSRYFTGQLDILLEAVCRNRLHQILEDKSSPDASFAQIVSYITMFENDIKYAADNGFETAVAHSLNEFNQYSSLGKIVFLHSIEGAHCLGNGNVDATTILQRIDTLFDMGICQFTLAHFFENILVSSQGGIPPKVRKLMHYDTANTYANGYNTRDNIAVQAVDHLLEKGIIIDLVHCTEGAKSMVYARNEMRGANKRPLVFSHTGIRSVVLKYSPQFTYPDALYLPGDDDILKIKDCNGVLGIIFMDYWLNGTETVSNAADVVIESIEYVARICGNYDNIAIGSDLDGFTEVPRDLAGPDKIPYLIQKMHDKGIAQADIDKICFGNYMRVLAGGWGKAM